MSLKISTAVSGYVERRDAGLAQDRRALRDVAAAHPAGEDRLALDLREPDQLAGGRGRVRHRLRREDDEQPVAAGSRGRDLERLGVPLRRRVADDVDRVVVAPAVGQDRVELVHRGRSRSR